jgi:hypothetical protein
MKYILPSEQKEIGVHPSQCQIHVKPVGSPLHVITAISNPFRYYSRYRLYQGFEKMVADAGGVLHTIELALRDRHFEVTTPDNPNHIQLRSPAILWHKENLINLAIQRLPADAEYVAWIDSDVQFARPDWVQETIHQLQIYKVVQMWTHNVDYGPEHQPIAQCSSLFASYMRDRHVLQPLIRNPNSQNKPEPAGGSLVPGPKGLMHTGYAWAARRSALSDLGLLGDIGILGSGDRHMAYALLGEVERSFPIGIHSAYKDYWLRWQARAEAKIQRKIGVVPGTINHYWHGSKQHRRYQDRWKILVGDHFNPLEDIKYDFQGILELTERNWKLRDDVIHYFSVRNEDSIDL